MPEFFENLATDILTTLSGLVAAQATLDRLKTGAPPAGDLLPALQEAAAEEDVLLSTLQELVVIALSREEDTSLETVLQALIEGQDAIPLTVLNACIQMVSVKSQTSDDEISQALLLPLVISRDMQNEQIPRAIAKKIEEHFVTAYASQGFNYCKVSPMLYDATIGYSLSAKEVYALNTDEPKGLRNLLTHSMGVIDDAQWTPTLCFMLAQVRYQPSLVSVRLDEPVDDAVTQDTARNCAKRMAHELAIVFGTPLLAGEFSTAFDVRAEAMQLYALHVAHRSLQMQLDCATVACHEVVATFHCEEDPDETSVPDELRISVIGEKGDVLAGHIVELNDWFDVEDAQQLLEEICRRLGIGTLNVSEVLVQTLDALHSPFFCNGQDWQQLANEPLRISAKPF